MAINWLRTKVRNLVNRVRRPTEVAQAQRDHLRRFPRCAACCSDVGGQAHHVKPYNKFPELGANPSNFITLCEHAGGLECHLHIGHGGDFRHYNPNVVEDAMDFRGANDVLRRTIIDHAKAMRQVDA